MRVAGLDVGTVSLDICTLADGRAEQHRSWETAALLARPSAVLDLLHDVELVVLAAGYGAPLQRIRDADEATLALAVLPDPRSSGGGIGGLRALLTLLGTLPAAPLLVPGVIHLNTVPRHRKLNRIDMGTADKVAVAALALALHGPQLDAIILELGGAFTAAVAIADGRIVDGIGGSAGPLGWRASGALDGEVAMLLDSVSKATVFRGGAADAVHLIGAAGAELAWLEGAAKAVRQLQVAAPGARRLLLSGRGAARPDAVHTLAALLPDLHVEPIGALPGFSHAKAGAQGAAVLADGLAAGRFASVVDQLALREASGTILDHLTLLDAGHARRRLGLA